MYLFFFFFFEKVINFNWPFDLTINFQIKNFYLFFMISRNKDILVLYLKNNSNNWSSVTSQTQNIRDNTNKKIRQLGNKYYIIRNLFDRLNLRRDDIFFFSKIYFFSKILEEEFKDLKNNIHIQNQTKRMKDAIYCWYAEFFFDELCTQNSILLKRLIEYCQKNKNPLLQRKQKSCPKSKQITKKQKINSQIKTNNEKNENTDKIEINQEIDTFDFSNSSTDNSKDTYSENFNFNFDKLLNF